MKEEIIINTISGSLQEKNGMYQAIFRINGEQKWKSLGIKVAKGNKRKAQKKFEELKYQLTDNPAMFDKIDLVEYSKKWLKRIKKDVDTVTYDKYKQHLEKHIIPYFKPLKLSLQTTTTAHIDDYYLYKSECGRLDGKEGGLSRASIKRHEVVLNSIFTEAVRQKLIKENPCRYASVPKQTDKPVKQPQFYTKEQCKELLRITEGTPLYDMIYITFLYGLRRSELMGLRWSDIDWDNNSITIQHTVVIGNGVVSKEMTKTKSSHRTYPLINDVKEILLRIQTKQKEYKRLFGNCYIDTDYIFCKEDGSVYYPDYPTKRLKTIIEKYQLSPIHWHSLRHSCASMLLAEGWNIKAISEWLGHSSVDITLNIYAHLNVEYKRELGNSLNGLFDNKKMSDKSKNEKC